MIRVGVHLEALRPGEIGGLEDYVRHLLAAMIALDDAPDPATFVLLCAEHNVDTFAPAERLEIHRLSAEDFAALDAERLEGFSLDLWFCPLLTLAPAEPGLPAVATVPDLQHEVYPEFFSPEILAWRRRHYRHTVARCDRVLTFSRHARDQLVDRLDADPARVVVTHLAATTAATAAGPPAAARDPAATVCARYGLAPGYFFYPGANWPHKNHRVLFDALARLERGAGETVPLVLTGSRIDGAVDLAAECRARGLRGVRDLGYVPKEDLPALYAASAATVFPSLFEGFGMPVVEAMRLGSPVLCSSATSLPEVAGDAAIYFDPERPEALCARIAAFRAAAGNGNHAELVRAGLRQAERFSWRRTARATLDAFRGALDDAATDAAVSVRVAPPATISAPSPASDALPLITVVTPSLDQERFIGATIDSVLGQDYPHVEHLVFDGASRDGTVEVLRRARAAHAPRFDFVSEPDRGQAHAVNKGFERARGEIVGWLNSDDLYEPGALRAVAEAFAAHPEWDAVYGRAHYVGVDGELLGVYPTRPDFHWQTLAHECFVCQPTVFVRRRVLDRFRLDESLQLCMDYDFWIRLGKDLEVRFLDRVLASSRMYPDNKTLGRRPEVYREVFRIVKKHYGRLPFSWTLGRAHHVWDRGDPFFDERRLTWVTYLIAGCLLVRHNWSSPSYWPALAREVWLPLSTTMRKRWRALYARDPTP